MEVLKLFAMVGWMLVRYVAADAAVAETVKLLNIDKVMLLAVDPCWL